MMAKVLSFQAGWIILEKHSDGDINFVVVTRGRAVDLYLHKYELEELIDELSKLISGKNEAH